MNTFKNVFQVKSDVIQSKTSRGVRDVLKVYDPENSTHNYNIHPFIRKGSNGCYVIAEKPYSANAGDHYLTIVLAFHGSQYVTWYENQECGGFNGGHYFDGDFEKAMQDFCKRGTWEWETNFVHDDTEGDEN